MEKFDIMETINSLFVGADERDWEMVEKAFAGSVMLDYTSMAGGEPAVMSAKQIIEAWKGLLPGFDKTHHQTGNFIISEN